MNIQVQNMLCVGAPAFLDGEDQNVMMTAEQWQGLDSVVQSYLDDNPNANIFLVGGKELGQEFVEVIRINAPHQLPTVFMIVGSEEDTTEQSFTFQEFQIEWRSVEGSNGRAFVLCLIGDTLAGLTEVQKKNLRHVYLFTLGHSDEYPLEARLGVALNTVTFLDPEDPTDDLGLGFDFDAGHVDATEEERREIVEKVVTRFLKENEDQLDANSHREKVKLAVQRGLAIHREFITSKRDMVNLPQAALASIQLDRVFPNGATTTFDMKPRYYPKPQMMRQITEEEARPEDCVVPAAVIANVPLVDPPMETVQPLAVRPVLEDAPVVGLPMEAAVELSLAIADVPSVEDTMMVEAAASVPPFMMAEAAASAPAPLVELPVNGMVFEIRRPRKRKWNKKLSTIGDELERPRKKIRVIV